MPSSPSAASPRPLVPRLGGSRSLKRSGTASSPPEIEPLAKIPGGQSQRSRFPFISPLLLPLIALALIPISISPGRLFTPNITDVVSCLAPISSDGPLASSQPKRSPALNHKLPAIPVKRRYFYALDPGAIRSLSACPAPALQLAASGLGALRSAVGMNQQWSVTQDA